MLPQNIARLVGITMIDDTETSELAEQISPVFIAGGTGHLGTQIVSRLVERRLKVRVLTRDPAHAKHLPTSHVEIVQGDVRDYDAVEQAISGAKSVISAVNGFLGDRRTNPQTIDHQGNSNLIKAASKNAVNKFILISISGAAPDHPLELFRMKYLAEKELQASGLVWTIIQATAFMETWGEILGEPLLKTGKTMLFGQGDNPINFVSIYDVEQFVESALFTSVMDEQIVEVGGPQNLSMRQVVKLFESAIGKNGKVSAIPLPMMRLMSVLMRPINPALARQIQAGIVMDTQNMMFSTTDINHNYPKISQTSFADVVKRDYMD